MLVDPLQALRLREGHKKFRPNFHTVELVGIRAYLAQPEVAKVVSIVESNDFQLCHKGFD